MMAVTKNNSLIEALLKAQQDFPDIVTATKGQAGGAKYLYATLPDILKKLLPVLHQNGLVLTQTAIEKDGAVWMQTNLHHVSGESLTSTVPLPMPTNWQQWGSAVTYARRYSITALLGVAPDADDDAASAQGFSRPAAAPAPSRLSQANREAMDVLEALHGSGQDNQEKRISYIQDVLAPKQINHPDDIKDTDWVKIKQSASDDLAFMESGRPAEDPDAGEQTQKLDF